MRTAFAFSVLLASAVLFSGCHSNKKSPPARKVTPLKQSSAKPPLPREVILVDTNAPVIPALTNSLIEQAQTNIQPPPPTVVSKAADIPKEPKGRKLIVTPDVSYSGSVTLVNNSAKFVVVTFPIGHLPAENQLMSLYRQGLKVGELKMTGPQKDDNVVADLLSGDAQLGDEAR